MAFLTNFTESLFSRIIPKNLSEKMPKTAGIIEKTRENFTEAGGVLEKINGKIGIVKESFKDISKIHKNAFKQIKSGKFGEAVTSDGDAGFGDMGDFGDFGSDDWGGDTSGGGDDWGDTSGGDGGSSEYGDVNNEVTNNYENNYTSNSYEGGSDGENVTAAVTAQTGITSSALASMGSLLSDISRQMEVLNVFHNEKTSEYYDASLDSFKSIAEFNTKLEENLKPVIEYYTEIAEKKNSRNKTPDEFDITQVMNPAYHLKKLLDSQVLSDEVIGMFTKGISDTITDPLGMAFQSALFGSFFNKGLIPTVAGGKMKRIEDFITFAPYMIQSKLQQWSNNRDDSGEAWSANNILAFLGDTFKMDVPRAKISANIDKGEDATFDARTRRAIITEIPIYLSKILKESQSASFYLKSIAMKDMVKGQREAFEAEFEKQIDFQIFDNAKGRFIGAKKKREDLNKEIETINDNTYSGGFANELESIFQSMKKEKKEELFGADQTKSKGKLDEVIRNVNKIANSTMAADADWSNAEDIMLRIHTINEEKARKDWEKENKDSRPKRKVHESDLAYENRVKAWEKKKKKEIEALTEKIYGDGGKKHTEKAIKALAADFAAEEEESSIERARQVAQLKYDKAINAAQKKKGKERAEAENEAKKEYSREISDAEEGETPYGRMIRASVMTQEKQKGLADSLNRELSEDTAASQIMALGEGSPEIKKVEQIMDIKSPVVFEAQNAFDRFFKSKSKLTNEVGNLFEDVGRYVTDKVETGIQKGVAAVDWTYTKLSNVGNYATAALMMTYSDKDWDSLLKQAENESFFEVMSESFDKNLITPLKKFMLGTSDDKVAKDSSFFEALKTGLEEKIFKPFNKLVFGADSDKSVWDSITESFSSMTEKATQYITEDLFGAAKTMFSEIGIQLQNAFEGVKNFLFEDLTEGTKSVFNSVFGENAIETIRSTLVEPFTNAVNKLSETVGSMIKWVFSLPIKLMNGITGFSQSVRGFSRDSEDDAVKTSKEKLSAIKENATDEAKEKLSRAGELIRSNEELQNKYRLLAAQKNMQVAESLNAFDEKQSLKANILSQLRADNSGEEFEAHAEEIADFIIEGMVGEITRSGDEISDVVKTNLGTEPLAAIREAWDIHSPSREMEQVGIFVIDGFLKPFLSKEEKNKVTKAVGHLFLTVPKDLITKAYGIKNGKSKYMADFAKNLIDTFIDTLKDNKKEVKDVFDSIFRLPIDVNGQISAINVPSRARETLSADAASSSVHQEESRTEATRDKKNVSLYDTNRILLATLNVQKKIKTVLEKILDKTGRIISTEGSLGRFADFKNNPFAYLGDQFGRLLQAPMNVLGQTAEGFGNFIEKMKDLPTKFLDLAADAAHGFAEGLKRMLPGIGQVIEGSLNSITQIFSSALQHGADWFDQILDRTGKGAEKVFEQLKSAFKPFADTIQEGMKVFFDQMAPSLEKLGGALNHVVIGLTEFGTKIFDTLLTAGNKVVDFGAGLFDYLRGRNGNGIAASNSIASLTRVNIVNWASSFGTKINPIFVHVLDGKVKTYEDPSKRTITAVDDDVQKNLAAPIKEKDKEEDNDDDDSSGIVGGAIAGVASGALGRFLPSIFSNGAKGISNANVPTILAGGNKFKPVIDGEGKMVRVEGNPKGSFERFTVQNKKNEIYNRLGTNDGTKFRAFNQSANNIESLSNEERRVRLIEEQKAKLERESALKERLKANNRVTSGFSDFNQNANRIQSTVQNLPPEQASPSTTTVASNNTRTPAERAKARTTALSERTAQRIERITAKGGLIPERLTRFVGGSDVNLSDEAKQNLQRSRTYHAKILSDKFDRNMTNRNLAARMGMDIDNPDRAANANKKWWNPSKHFSNAKHALGLDAQSRENSSVGKAFRDLNRGKALSDGQKALIEKTRANYHPNMSQKEQAALEHRLAKRATFLGGVQNFGVNLNQKVTSGLTGAGNSFKSIGGNIRDFTGAAGASMREAGKDIRAGQYQRALGLDLGEHRRTLTSRFVGAGKDVGGMVGKGISTAGRALESSATTRVGRFSGMALRGVGGVTEKAGRFAANVTLKPLATAASLVTNKAAGAGLSLAGAGVQAVGKGAAAIGSLAGSATSMAGRAFTGVQNMSMGKSLGLGLLGGLGTMAADNYLEKNSTEQKLAKSASGLMSDLGMAGSLNAIPVVGQIASALYVIYKVFTRVPELFTALVNFVEDKFKDQINGMTTFFLEVPSKIEEFTSKIPAWIEGLGNNLTTSIENMFDGPSPEDFDPETGMPIDSGKPSILWQMAKAFGKAIGTLAVNLPSILITLGESLAKTTLSVVSKALFEWIPNIFSQLGYKVTEIINDSLDSFGLLWDRTKYEIGYYFKTFFNESDSDRAEKEAFQRTLAEKEFNLKKLRTEEKLANLQKYQEDKAKHAKDAAEVKDQMHDAVDTISSYNPMKMGAEWLKEAGTGLLNDDETRFANRYRESMEAAGGDESKAKAEYAKRFLKMSDDDIGAAIRDNYFDSKLTEGGYGQGKDSFEKVIRESEERRYKIWLENEIKKGEKGTDEEFRSRFKANLQIEREHKGKDSFGFNQGGMESTARATNRAEVAQNATSSWNGVPSSGNIKTSNKSSYTNEQVLDAIRQASTATGVDYGLLYRMAVVESNLDPDANRDAPGDAAKGLFQFKSATAREMNLLDVFNPYQSALAGANYIKQNFSMLAKEVPRTPLTAYLAHQQGAGGISQIWMEAVRGNNAANLSSDRRENMIRNSPFGDSKLYNPKEFIAGWQRKIGEPANFFADVDVSNVKVNSNIAKAISQMPSLGSAPVNSSTITETPTPAEVAQSSLPPPPPDPMLASSSASSAMSFGESSVTATPANTSGMIGTSVSNSSTPSPSTFAPQESASTINSTVNSYKTAQNTSENLILEELRKQSEYLAGINGNTDMLKNGLNVTVQTSQPSTTEPKSLEKNNEIVAKQTQPTVDFFGNLINGQQKANLSPSSAALRIAAGGTV